MYLWRIDYRGKVVPVTLGTVAAVDETAAIKKAADLFQLVFGTKPN